MITIIAKSIIKEGSKEYFKKNAKELINESRKEEGCISYNLYEDLKNKEIMVFLEEWKDEKSIEMHKNSEHYKRIIPILNKFRKGPSEITLLKKTK